MSYGTPEWMPWVLNAEEGVKHIKAAYDAGLQTFDTANVGLVPGVALPSQSLKIFKQIYSNGLSEEILGRAIKEHNLPRDEIGTPL